MQTIVCACEWGYGDMGAGLQVFSESGNIILDVSDRLTKVVGEFETHGKNGSLVDLRLENMDHWIACTYDTNDVFYASDSHDIAPKVIRAGNALSWQYPVIWKDNRPWPNHKFVYGVY